MSTLVGTLLLGALMVSVLVVAPLIKRTRTCGATELVWLATTKTRTQALRSFTNGTAGAG
jgi:hypothetical protein